MSEFTASQDDNQKILDAVSAQISKKIDLHKHFTVCYECDEEIPNSEYSGEALGWCNSECQGKTCLYSSNPNIFAGF